MSKNTRDLIIQFVKTEFKLKYNNSALGFIWVLIKPLVLFLIIFVVLTRVFPNNIEYYALYLLLGTIVFGYFSESTIFGINSLLNKQNLILKVNFPRYIVVISAMLLPAINFFINLTVFFSISIIFYGKIPGIFAFLWFIVAYISLFLIMLGFSLFTSIWHVKLRDIGSIWELLLQLFFWTTPIIYTLEVIKQKSSASPMTEFIAFAITNLNPVSVVLQVIREAFIYNKISHIDVLLYWFIFGVIFAILGYFYFKKAVKKIAEDF